MQPLHLHIEGMDLAGKSTICRRLLAHHLPAHTQAFRNALLADNPIYAIAEDWRCKATVGDVGIGWAYVAALEYDLTHWQSRPRQSLQDSTVFLRSLAFHSVHGNNDIVRALLALEPRHPRFSQSIVCVANRETRERRLAIRRPDNLGPEDLLVRDDWPRFAAMEQALLHHAKEFFAAQAVATDILENDPELQQLAPVLLRNTRL